MSQEIYPKEVNQSNLPVLVERAKQTKKRDDRAFFGMIICYFVIAYFVSPTLLFVSGQVVIASYPKPVPFTTEVQIGIVLTFLALYVTFLLYLYWGLEIAVRKLARIKYDELVFFECVLIANNLKSNNRQGAIKEVDGFVAWLARFQGRPGYNSKAKRYAAEIKLLTNGKKELKRLLLFFTDKGVSDLFINFGLTLINGYDASAFGFLRGLVTETEKYGKLEGWFDKIKGRSSALQVVSVSVASILGVVTILNLLGVI